MVQPSAQREGGAGARPVRGVADVPGAAERSHAGGAACRRRDARVHVSSGHAHTALLHAAAGRVLRRLRADGRRFLVGITRSRESALSAISPSAMFCFAWDSGRFASSWIAVLQTRLVAIPTGISSSTLTGHVLSSNLSDAKI